LSCFLLGAKAYINYVNHQGLPLCWRRRNQNNQNLFRSNNRLQGSCERCFYQRYRSLCRWRFDAFFVPHHHKIIYACTNVFNDLNSVTVLYNYRFWVIVIIEWVCRYIHNIGLIGTTSQVPPKKSSIWRVIALNKSTIILKTIRLLKRIVYINYP